MAHFTVDSSSANYRRPLIGNLSSSSGRQSIETVGIHVRARDRTKLFLLCAMWLNYITLGHTYCGLPNNIGQSGAFASPSDPGAKTSPHLKGLVSPTVIITPADANQEKGQLHLGSEGSIIIVLTVIVMLNIFWLSFQLWFTSVSVIWFPLVCRLNQGKITAERYLRVCSVLCWPMPAGQCNELIYLNSG